MFRCGGWLSEIAPYHTQALEIFGPRLERRDRRIVDAAVGGVKEQPGRSEGFRVYKRDNCPQITEWRKSCYRRSYCCLTMHGSMVISGLIKLWLSRKLL